MESLFYLRWDKGREAMAAQQRKDKFNLIPFFENGRNQLNYLSLCGRAALCVIWEWRLVWCFLSLVGYGRCQRQGLRQRERTNTTNQPEWINEAKEGWFVSEMNLWNEMNNSMELWNGIELWMPMEKMNETPPQGANSSAARQRQPTKQFNQLTSQKRVKWKLIWFALVDCAESCSAIKNKEQVGYEPEAPLPRLHSAAKKFLSFPLRLACPSFVFIKEKTSGGVEGIKRS